MKKVIIAGASGMVGGLVLEQSLNSNVVEQVINLVRKPTGIEHEKLEEVVINDFLSYTEHQSFFEGVSAAFFCIGAYTGQVPDDLFKLITVDYAVAFAKALQENSPEAKLCLLSGAGADRTEKSRMSFAKYKGMAENQIADLGFEHFYSFRPSYIYPVTPRKEPNFGYKISRLLYPLIKLFGTSYSIKSTELAEAIFQVGINGTAKSFLENKDILEVIAG